jgi:hypothetical protein
MKTFEIRLNPFDSLGFCEMCNCDSCDPDWAASRKCNAPELFTNAPDGSLKWVCFFCVRHREPVLAVLIELARIAEKYADPNEIHSFPIYDPSSVAFQLAIRIDSTAKDGPCGICGHETVSSSYPHYQPGYPELFFNGSIVCAACGQSTAPVLDLLRELGDRAEKYAKHLPKNKA